MSIRVVIARVDLTDLEGHPVAVTLALEPRDTGSRAEVPINDEDWDFLTELRAMISARNDNDRRRDTLEGK